MVLVVAVVVVVVVVVAVAVVVAVVAVVVVVVEQQKWSLKAQPITIVMHHPLSIQSPEALFACLLVS